MSNFSQAVSISNPLTPLEESKASTALDALLSAPNQERRGRPTDETLLRIHNFLKTDAAFLEHKQLAPTLGIDPIKFEAEMIGQLKWIDKLITNNPGLIDLADLGPDRVHAYQYISTMTLVALAPSSPNIENPSIEKPKLKRESPLKAIEPDILAIVELPAVDHLAPNKSDEKQKLSQTVLDSLLDNIIRFADQELQRTSRFG